MQPLSPDILNVIASWPQHAQQHLLTARTIAFDVAEAQPATELTESLKWGEPAWRPLRGGTTLRMSWKADQDALGLFVDCKTDLCARMQSDFPDAFRYAAPRALYLDANAALPQDALRHLAEMAFRYKRVLPVV
ncbi:MAG: DUF1801 domain-containing protein [Pseudomonadota bacterium]